MTNLKFRAEEYSWFTWWDTARFIADGSPPLYPIHW